MLHSAKTFFITTAMYSSEYFDCWPSVSVMAVKIFHTWEKSISRPTFAAIALVIEETKEEDDETKEEEEEEEQEQEEEEDATETKEEGEEKVKDKPESTDDKMEVEEDKSAVSPPDATAPPPLTAPNPDDPDAWDATVAFEIESSVLEEVEAMEDRIFTASLQVKVKVMLVWIENPQIYCFKANGTHW